MNLLTMWSLCFAECWKILACFRQGGLWEYGIYKPKTFQYFGELRGSLAEYQQRQLWMPVNVGEHPETTANVKPFTFWYLKRFFVLSGVILCTCLCFKLSNYLRRNTVFLSFVHLTENWVDKMYKLVKYFRKILNISKSPLIFCWALAAELAALPAECFGSQLRKFSVFCDFSQVKILISKFFIYSSFDVACPLNNWISFCEILSIQISSAVQRVRNTVWCL